MKDHIYKHIELTGSSTVSSDDAVRDAIKKAANCAMVTRWPEDTLLRDGRRHPSSRERAVV